MKRDFEYFIAEDNCGKTIQEFLKQQGYSHAVIVHLKKTEESILLNGIWEYLNTRLSTGDILTVHLVENEGSATIVPTPLPLSICYEDDDILVVNKAKDPPFTPP